MSDKLFEIKDLYVNAEEKEILKGINLSINKGEIHVIMGPKKVVYVSCNPVTLARDLKYMVKHGYKVEKIQPVDMFPFCDHVENVVLMSKAGKR